MGEGLFPKRWQGWWLLVVLGVVYYSVYYFLLYPPLYEKYLSGYWHPAPAQKCNADVSIRVRAPQFVSEYVQRSLAVSVTNLTDQPIPQLVIGVSPLDEDQDLIDISAKPSALALTRPEEGSILPGFIQFDSMPAHATITGVFNIYVKKAMEESGEADSKSISLQVYCDGRLLDGPIAMKYSPKEVMRYSLIEVALLPPWSNGILAFLALLVVKLVEDAIPEDPPNPWETLWGYLWAVVLAAGLSLLLLSFTVLLAEIVLPGWPSWPVLISGIVGALLVSFLFRLALWKITGRLEAKGLGIVVRLLLDWINRRGPKAGGSSGCRARIPVDAKYCPTCGKSISPPR